jgi:RHS repeat-associated protein
MGFRDYNPGLNRFVSRDNYNGPLSDLNLGLNPWTGNRYAFAGGNPVTGVELDGHGLCADDGCMYVCSAECSNEEAAELSNRMAADRKAADDAAREDRNTHTHTATTSSRFTSGT